MVIKFNGKDITQLFLGNIELNAVYKDGVLYFGGTASSGGTESGGGGGTETQEPVDNPNLLASINEDRTIHLKDGTYRVYGTREKAYIDIPLTSSRFGRVNDSTDADRIYSAYSNSNGYVDIYLNATYNSATAQLSSAILASEVADTSQDMFLGRLKHSEKYDKYYLTDKTE
nr:MAG TPA: hypothetical protein [Caudoviricetes sp.]